MTTEPMGTIVVNEVVMPVLRIWLEQGAFRVQAQIKALDRAIDFDDRKYDYRLHSMDGQVVLRGRVAFGMPVHLIPPHDVLDYTLTLWVPGGLGGSVLGGPG
jgi:hypothetical protein